MGQSATASSFASPKSLSPAQSRVLLAQSACRTGTTVLYKRLPRLFDELELATAMAAFRACFEA
jgi:hypothetical protein